MFEIIIKVVFKNVFFDLTVLLAPILCIMSFFFVIFKQVMIKEKKIRYSVFEIMVKVVFESVFFLKIHQNNIFLLFKIYF